MTREQAIKILNSKKSSKELIREALAWALNVPIDKGCSREPSVFNQCKLVFSSEYRRVTGVPYVFGVKEGVALAGIIKKIEELGDVNVINTFTALVQHLPEWYKKNAFSIPVINSKFNEIIASISKKTGTVNGNSSEREAVRAAFSRTNQQ